MRKFCTVILLVLIAVNGWSKNPGSGTFWSAGFKLTCLPAGQLWVLGEPHASTITSGPVTTTRYGPYRDVFDNEMNTIPYGAAGFVQVHLTDKSGIGYGFGFCPQIMTGIQNLNLSNKLTEVTYNLQLFIEYEFFGFFNPYFNIDFGLACLYTKDGTQYDKFSEDPYETMTSYEISNHVGWNTKFDLGLKFNTKKNINPFVEIGGYYSEYKYSEDDYIFRVGGRNGLFMIALGIDFTL